MTWYPFFARIPLMLLPSSGFENATITLVTPSPPCLHAAAAESLDEGIVVSGYRFEDMLYLDLRQYLPDHIDMLMISSPNRWRGQDTGNVICLAMPLKVSDLLSTMDMMVQARTKGRGRRRPKERSQKQQEIIQEAKALLMERNGMTEAEAHRYIQKCSMDSGNNLVETARMVISLIRW